MVRGSVVVLAALVACADVGASQHFRRTVKATVRGIQDDGGPTARLSVRLEGGTELHHAGEELSFDTGYGADLRASLVPGAKVFLSWSYTSGLNPRPDGKAYWESERWGVVGLDDGAEDRRIAARRQELAERDQRMQAAIAEDVRLDRIRLLVEEACEPAVTPTRAAGIERLLIAEGAAGLPVLRHHLVRAEGASGAAEAAEEACMGGFAAELLARVIELQGQELRRRQVISGLVAAVEAALGVRGPTN